MTKAGRHVVLASDDRTRMAEKRASDLSRAERLGMLECGPAAELPLATQARLLSLNRSRLYYRAAGPTAEELGLRRRIDELCTRWPFYGSRRITAVLRRAGLAVNRKAVQRQMREMGIEAIYPGPNLSRRRQRDQEVSRKPGTEGGLRPLG